MTTQIPSVRLNNGYDIPMIGLGTWKSTPTVATEVVKDAIDVGYRHIDCAFVFGNEAGIGAAIQEKIDEGAVRREDLFITSKLWNTFHNPSSVQPAMKQSLKDLGLDYLDLYCMHWPMDWREGTDVIPQDVDTMRSDYDYVDTWKAMEELVNLGLTRSIGLSNFNKTQIERICANATICPAVVQVESHPYLAQTKLMEYCQARCLAVTAYSPLGSSESPWVRPCDPRVLADPKLIELGQRYNKSAAQIVLRWQLQRGVIVIPKSAQRRHLEENISVLDFELTPCDMAYMESFDKQNDGRLVAFSWASSHPHYPFNDDV